ncbi:MAG: hypothetical protein M3301_01720 [Chloroflexota bacterium]|nr:hypothetical protein [Chloroflexota bacterium]
MDVTINGAAKMGREIGTRPVAGCNRVKLAREVAGAVGTDRGRPGDRLAGAEPARSAPGALRAADDRLRTPARRLL